MVRSCENCGEPFAPTPRLSPEAQEFCSRACRETYRARGAPTGTPAYRYEGAFDSEGELIAWRAAHDDRWNDPPGPPELEVEGRVRFGPK